MRLLAFLGLLILTAAGPWYYLTKGAAARAERRSHLESVARAAAGVKGLLDQHGPPSRRLLDLGQERLAARRTALRRFAEEVTAAGTRPPPTAEELRQLARSTGVDERVVAPILATLPGDPLAGERRFALAAVLSALGESGPLILAEARFDRKLARREARLPVKLLGVSLRVLGSATDLIRLSERLAQGSDRHPPADLITLSLKRLPEDAWNRPGFSAEAPPLELRLLAELIVGPEDLP